MNYFKRILVIGLIVSGSPGAALAEDTLRSVGSSRDALVQQATRNAVFSVYSTGNAAAWVDVNFSALSGLEPIQGNCIARQIVELAKFFKSNEYRNLADALVARNVRNGFPNTTSEATYRYRISLLDNSSKTRSGGWFNESDNTERMLGRTARRGGKNYTLTLRVPAIAVSELEAAHLQTVIAPALNDRNECKIVDQGALKDNAKTALAKMRKSDPATAKAAGGDGGRLPASPAKGK